MTPGAAAAALLAGAVLFPVGLPGFWLGPLRYPGWLAVIAVALLFRRSLPGPSGRTDAPAITPGMELLLVVVLTLGALLLRVVKIGTIPPGLWIDEAVEGLQGAAAWSGEGVPDLPEASLVYPRWPLWWAIEAAATRFGGMTTWAIRLPAALVGTAAVPLAWIAARSLFGSLGGLAAAAFIATSFWHVQVSRLALAPVMVAPAGLLAAWLMLAPGFRGRVWPPFLAGAIAGAACYDYPAAAVLPVFIVLAAALRLLSGLRRGRPEFAPAGAACAGLLLALAPVVFLSGGRMARIASVGVALPGLLFGQAVECLTNLFAPVAGGLAYWNNYPPGAARSSPFEVFGWLAGVASLGRTGVLPGWTAWAVGLWLPISLLPEVLPGGGIHLIRGSGALAPLALLSAAGACAWAASRPRRVLWVILLLAAVNAGLTARTCFGPFARDPDVKRRYMSPIVDAAESMKSLARQQAVSVFPPINYRDAPQLAFLLWNEIHSGRIVPASSPPPLDRALAVFREPLGGQPAIMAVVPMRFPADNTVGLIDVDWFIAEGRNWERSGEWGRAESTYRTIIRLAPDAGRAHAALGLMHLRRGARASARRELDLAARLGVSDPEVFRAMRGLGMVRIFRGFDLEAGR